LLLGLLLASTRGSRRERIRPLSSPEQSPGGGGPRRRSRRATAGVPAARLVSQDSSVDVDDDEGGANDADLFTPREPTQRDESPTRERGERDAVGVNGEDEQDLDVDMRAWDSPPASPQRPTSPLMPLSPPAAPEFPPGGPATQTDDNLRDAPWSGGALRRQQQQFTRLEVELSAFELRRRRFGDRGLSHAQRRAILDEDLAAHLRHGIDYDYPPRNGARAAAVRVQHRNAMRFRRRLTAMLDDARRELEPSQPKTASGEIARSLDGGLQNGTFWTFHVLSVERRGARASSAALVGVRPALKINRNNNPIH
jgi:hypothetical protein